MKGAPLTRRARTEPSRATAAARKKASSAREIVVAGLSTARKGKLEVHKRLVGLRTQAARWLKKNPGRAVIGACAGAFALGVSVTKVARRS
jgi:hypothetical protein